METLLNEIECYWTKRAPSYTDVVERNLKNGWDDVWAAKLSGCTGKPTMQLSVTSSSKGIYSCTERLRFCVSASIAAFILELGTLLTTR